MRLNIEGKVNRRVRMKFGRSYLVSMLYVIHVNRDSMQRQHTEWFIYSCRSLVNIMVIRSSILLFGLTEKRCSSIRIKVFIGFIRRILPCGTCEPNNSLRSMFHLVNKSYVRHETMNKLTTRIILNFPSKIFENYLQAKVKYVK